MLENELHYIKKFEKALRDYRPKIEFIDVLNSCQFVMLVAPAAAGRNTVIRHLIMTGKYRFIISDTTRRPRINNGIPEVSGNEYWFRSEEEFLQGLKRGDYIGAAIIHNQQVSGINIFEFESTAQEKKIGITDIDIQGCDFLQQYKPDAINIFMLPPAFDEWIKRLEGRGAIDKAEERRRLESAVSEITAALKRNYFIFITNWDLRVTSEKIHEVVTTGKYDQQEMVASRAHAEELLQMLHKRLR